MANPLQYTDVDFTTSGGVVDPEQLRQEFAAASFPSTPVVFSHVDQVGVGGTLLVSVWFDTDPDATDTTTADAIVAAHTATGPENPEPDPEADGLLLVRIRNETGGLLSRATPLVAAVGFSVPNNAYLVDAADKDDPALRPAFGALTEDLPNGQNGVALVRGDLKFFDTSGFSLTDQLVLGDAGAFSRPPPDVDPFTGEVQNVGQVRRVDAAEGVIQLNFEGQLAVTADGVFGLESSLDRGVQSGFTLTRGGGLDIDIAAGVGFVSSGGLLKRLVFAGGTIALPTNSSRYIYVDAAGVIQLSASLPNLSNNIVLANARTDGTDVVYVSTHLIPIGGTAQRGHIFAAEVIGPTVHSGGSATVNGGDALAIDVDSAIFYITGNRKTVPATVGIAFAYWYRDGGGGQTLVTGQTQIDPDNYDDGSGTLAAVPAGEWKKDALYLAQNNDGTTVEYHLVYGQETFVSQSEAEAGPLPVPADDLEMFALLVAGIVSQEGASGITSIVDERPFLGQLKSGTTAVSDHGLLGGLGDDDHPQYLRTDGTRALTGDLDLGSNDIVSVGTVDGRDVNADGGTLDGHVASMANPHGVTAAQAGAAPSSHVGAGGAEHAAATTSVAGFLSAADKTKLDALLIEEVFSERRLRAALSANWAVNSGAGFAPDSVNAALLCWRFDDTVEEGVGFQAFVPAGMTNLVLKFKSRAQTTPPAGRTVGLGFYRRAIPDNSAVGAWSAVTALTNIDIPTNTNWQYDSQTLTLASLGMTAGQFYQFELTRRAPTAGTNLSGDWDLLEVRVGFT